MEQLLKKSKVDKVKLKTYINKVVSTELTKLNSPCYAPPYKNYYGEEILYLTDLTKQDIQNFVKRFHQQRLAADYLLKEWITNTLLFTLHYFSKQKDVHGVMVTMTLFCINSYSHKFFKFFRFCNPDVFSYTLDQISKTNLMAREKTISNFLYYIAQEMVKRHGLSLENFDNPEEISKFVYECNHRINQTLRSFANLYHKNAKEGAGYAPSEKEGKEGSYEVEVTKKYENLIDNIVKQITVYKEIDRNALDEAKKLSRINILLAEYISKEITNLKYSDDIKLIYELFLKDIKTVNQLCGKDFYKYTSNLMGIKRTVQKVYYKQQVSKLTERIIIGSKYEKAYLKLTNQTKFLTHSFTSYYLAIFLRNKVC